MRIRTAAAAIAASLALTTSAFVGSAPAGTPLPLPPLPDEAPAASPIQQTADWSQVQTARPIQQAGYQMGMTYGLPAAPEDPASQPTVPMQGYGPVIPGNLPRTAAPLYPAPVQNVPTYGGGTVITNQALAPHEMLYPHEYNAMYGPYYYSVRGGFIWTPFGMRTHEKWKLQGTQVNVKYHDKIRLFSGYKPYHHIHWGWPEL